jgi:hypothetical protein
MGKAALGNTEVRAVEQIKTDQLLLDAENPRLASGTGGASPKELLKTLWTEMAVDEVALSIAANGFFQEEPLFAIPFNPKEKIEAKRKYTVVEGNRRLAAVKLLTDDVLRKEIGATDLPKLTPAAKAKLTTLPVSLYANRKELWQYFGFRHINGPKPWDAFSKAKYVSEVHEQFGVDLPDIANSIGDRHSTVVRLYRGFKILEQAEKSGRFQREDAVRNRFYFSHLYTAADQPDFQKFLGITAGGSLRLNPIPASKLDELRELMTWLYGSKQDGKEPVVKTQNPHLNQLREVISSRPALSALRAGYSLERSLEISIGDSRRFREALTRAKEDLQQAKATVTTGYSGEADLYETMDSIVLVADTVRTEMASKQKKGTKRD